MAKWTWEVLVRTETTLQTESLPLRFSPYYKSGGGIDIDRKDTFPQRGETKEYDNTSYQPPLAYNVSQLYLVADFENENFKLR